MGLSLRIEKLFKILMPGPFGLAIVLTVLAMLMSLFKGTHSVIEIGQHWQRGFWDPPMMVFTLQMALILVLGYSVAISPPATRLIHSVLKTIKTQGQGIILLTVFSMTLGWVNWGLGLIFGAVMARKLAESFQKRNIPFYFPLLGAGGYAGMMTWHSGLSGSAPLKAAEFGHLVDLSPNTLGVPDFIPLAETVFSTRNILAFTVLLFAIPFLLWLFRKKHADPGTLKPFESTEFDAVKPQGAEKFEHWKFPAMLIGSAILVIVLFELFVGAVTFGPNSLNSIFLALALLVYGTLSKFFQSIRAGMDGAAAILIQFPFYFGIMGILRYGGLIDDMTQFFVQSGAADGMGYLIMASSGLVNFFVPSGGGQWAVQGPLIISLCSQLEIPLSRGIMAMAYGDQLTNMLQPFWALPLLSITGLKAHRVLPYTFLMMMVGVLVYVLVV
ncbi:MAG: short-chain fatty acid transporter [Cryomorphaceae bacterium]|nr:short-chain fatty acid transporter [Cryomorphaceae bacterium]